MPRPTTVLLVSCAALTFSRAADAAPTEDRWFGPDKPLHFGVSAMLASGGYAAGTQLWPERWKALVLGGTVALGAGAAKEAIDATGAGDPSWRDFTWDVGGAAVGLGIAVLVDVVVSKEPVEWAGNRCVVRF